MNDVEKRPPTLHELLDAQYSNDPQYSLFLSALTREGDPFLWCLGDKDVPLCVYDSPLPPGKLRLHGWSENQNSFCFVPETAFRVTYRRKAFIGETPPDVVYSGAIFDQPKNQSPWFFLDKYGDDPFPFHFPEDSPALPRSSSGPPFQFYVQDGGRYCGPSDLFKEGVQVSIPDLHVQAEAIRLSNEKDTKKFLEPWSSKAPAMDTYRKHGWGGEWVRDVLLRSMERRPLGSLIKTIWCGNDEWGIEVQLDPISLTETTEPGYDNMEDGDDYEEAEITMEAYEVTASVLRVLVKPTFFALPPSRCIGSNERSLEEVAWLTYKRARLDWLY